MDVLRRILFGTRELATLGEVSAPREIALTGAVVANVTVTSPVSGLRCAYYHAEIGETVELCSAETRTRGERHTFRPFAEMKSPSDLVVATADGQRVVLPSGFFLVRGGDSARRGRRFARIPEGISAMALGGSRDEGALGYREIALRAGDLVRFSGTIEAVMSEAREGYRGAPRRAFRMRPEREPIVVEALATPLYASRLVVS